MTLKRILVVNVNWLGDVVFSSPVFKALKQNYPGARVVCLAVPRVKKILEFCPGLDDILVYDEDGVHWSFWGKCLLIAELRRQKFDAVFLLHGSWTRALMVALAGVPGRVGYAAKKRGWLLTHRVAALSEGAHRGDIYLNVLESYGVKVTDRSCELAVPQAIKDEARAVLERHGIGDRDPLIALHVGGNWDLKRWPKEYWGQLIRRVRGETSMKIVLTGGDGDVSLCSEIVRLSQSAVPVLAGQTDLGQLMGVMQRARLVISADSGPLHIASSVGTRVVGLFGPTRPEVTGPRGQAAATILQKDTGCNLTPCYYLECPDPVCMKSLTVDDVMTCVQDGQI